MKDKAARKKEEEHLSTEQKIRREIIAWFWVGLVFLLINGTLGQARVIPSRSMENTLLVGDHLIMSRFGYDAGIPFTNIHTSLWKDPKRQQIIIFKPPHEPDQPDFVKRVIGLPGETVDVHDGAVWINGKKLEENYTVGETVPGDPGQFRGEFSGKTNVFPYKVPENCYFAMGDNRRNSLDSRYWGCVPRKNIIGTPLMIYMSLDAPERSWQPGELGARFTAYLNGILHPSTVRWRRLFHIF